MTLTRRAFISSAATVAAASVVGAAGTGVADAATPQRPLRRSTFAPLVGRLMTATHGHRSVRIRLRRVDHLVGQRHDDASFLLEFSSSRHLADGIYTIDSPAAGRHELFLSAVNAAHQRRYAVVVNHARPPA